MPNEESLDKQIYLRQHYMDVLDELEEMNDEEGEHIIALVKARLHEINSK